MNARVLSNWQPSSYDKQTIEREFLAECRRQGIRICNNSLEIRGPAKHQEARIRKRLGDPSFDWHFDQHGGGERSDHILVMWSNVLPTEVASGYERLKTRPGDILLVDNMTTKHKIPKGVENVRRWFVRAHTHQRV